MRGSSTKAIDGALPEPWPFSHPRTIRVPGIGPEGEEGQHPLWLWGIKWVTTGKGSHPPPSGPGTP